MIKMNASMTRYHTCMCKGVEKEIPLLSFSFFAPLFARHHCLLPSFSPLFSSLHRAYLQCTLFLLLLSFTRACVREWRRKFLSFLSLSLLLSLPDITVSFPLFRPSSPLSTEPTCGALSSFSSSLSSLSSLSSHPTLPSFFLFPIGQKNSIVRSLWPLLAIARERRDKRGERQREDKREDRRERHFM